MSAAREIDAIIKATGGWHGALLVELRALVTSADGSITEEVKWKKPSRPEGVPVWVSNGNLCIAEALKNCVRLTFPNGARLTDPKGIFNARMDSNSVRAVDFHQGDKVSGPALRALVRQAVKLNAAKKG